MDMLNRMDRRAQPLVVAIGGTAVAGSSTETALRLALEAAAEMGARTRLFGGSELSQLPLYLTPASRESVVAATLIDAVREADGLILASPGYHGSVSGLFKNAIDYLEETSSDERTYLDGLPVGLITTAYGWQATNSTLAAMRAIVHALRGWPTPFGATINSADKPFGNGRCLDPNIGRQLTTIGRQVYDLAHLRRIDPRDLVVDRAPPRPRACS